MLLNGRLTLHQPECDGRRCVPDECIADVEKFARSVISAHERAGVKRNGSLDRPGMTLTSSEREDLLAFLVSTAWEARQRFRPGNDGRAKRNRFAGYAAWVLHKRLVDWIRQTKGSTRFPNSRIVATLVPLTPSIEERMAPLFDPEFDDDDCGLDLDVAPEGTCEALAVVGRLVDDERLTQGALAAQLGVPAGRVSKAVRLVREEATRQGLAPTNAAEVATRVETRARVTRHPT